MLHAKLYVDRQLSGKDFIGLIEIHKSSQVPATYTFADTNGSVTSPAIIYAIVFGRIMSTWKYYIILSEIDVDPGLSITYASPIPGEEPYPSAVTFNSIPPGAGLTETYGSGKVILFESDKELPIYEIPKKNIKLIKPQEAGNGNGPAEAEATKTLLKNLPNASISAIKPNEDNSKVFSEIYVFI
jgi:hypothetical protein